MRYSVTYNSNNATAGTPPSDTNAYVSNATVTVAANAGSLTQAGYTFDGWCTTQPAAGAPCTGTQRSVATTFIISSNVTLYAVWARSIQNITFAAGGGLGSAPSSPVTVTYGSTFTIPANSYTRVGRTFTGWSDGTDTYAVGATYPASGSVSADVTLTATWSDSACPTGGPCAVGDPGPGGGVVFYAPGSPFTSTGSECNTACLYLEAAAGDQATASDWCNDELNALGVTSLVVGSGMANTTTADVTCSSGAIQIAANYTNNGKSDWHLPSFNELSHLFTNRGAVGGFAEAAYWSSTERFAWSAWSQWFTNGTRVDNHKGLSIRVRVVRAFTDQMSTPAFTLSSSSESVMQNTAISGYAITLSGGAVASWSLDPAVPAGMSFDTSSGELSGTPTSAQAATEYTITATNQTGSASQIFTLTVQMTCANGGVCAVGDTGPGGGRVFYVHSSGTFDCGATLASTCKYLEAAPTSGTNAWTDDGYVWSEMNTEIGIAARNPSIGTGFKNTEAMVTQSSTVVPAGTITRAYRGPNNLTDWYLPSKDELNELCKYARNTGQAAGTSTVCAGGTLRSDFSAVNYWSSSEFNDNYAAYQLFSTGFAYAFSKHLRYFVRPVRAFG